MSDDKTITISPTEWADLIRRAQANALRDAADAYLADIRPTGDQIDAADWLRDRADRLVADHTEKP